jgi:hypothetical protein
MDPRRPQEASGGPKKQPRNEPERTWECVDGAGPESDGNKGNSCSGAQEGGGEGAAGRGWHGKIP